MIYTEADLVVPALSEIAQHAHGLTTRQLLGALRRSLRPEGDDLILLEGRNDDRFSQKVRNLKSHNTLQRDAYATFDEKDHKFNITDKGRRLVSAGEGVTESLARQGFSIAQRIEALNKGFAEVVVEEGSYKYLSVKVIQRSRDLRNAAIKYFANSDGSIKCTGCEGRAEDTYGVGARGLIEIHHLRPLYLRSGKGSIDSIAEALKSVEPLCPSCHRFVHFKQGAPLSIPNLRDCMDLARQK